MKHVLLPLFALLSLSLFAQAGPQLDSTVTYYGYDIYNFPGGYPDTVPLFRSIFRYPQTGVRIEEQSEFQGNEWATQNQSTLIYDDQNRLVEVVGALYDPNTREFILDSRLEVYPHKNSPTLLDSTFVSQWDGLANDWVRVFETLNFYDNQDTLRESVSRFFSFGEVLEIQEYYTYDDKGDNTLIESYVFTGGVLYPSGQVQTIYEDHKPVEAVALAYNGAGFLEQSRNTYAYTDFDSLAQTRSFEWDIELFDWFNTQTVNYAYYDDQRLQSRETIFYEKDGPENKEKVEFDYLADGPDLQVEHIYLLNQQVNAYYLDSRKYYYYPATTALPTPPRRVEALTLSPNPGTGPVRTSLEREAQVSVYGPNGQLLASRQLQPGETLDFSAYPSGLYRVVAQDGQKVFVGAVVKE